MRGSQAGRKMTREGWGIIPAHAGLTDNGDANRADARDHPRACGAHVPAATAFVKPPGSSPRMRGSLFLRLLLWFDTGIIPAHAGLTWSQPLQLRRPRDHPRACGAHLYNLLAHCSAMGSSPRMRGSHASSSAHLTATRIIPAHAGLTQVRKVERTLEWDHPRACGAHLELGAMRSRRWGSSPRMRGSQNGGGGGGYPNGIIPAHAGLTVIILDFYVHHWDHPRACGAHSLISGIIVLATGSSPRMRGSLLS